MAEAEVLRVSRPAYSLTSSVRDIPFPYRQQADTTKAGVKGPRPVEWVLRTSSLKQQRKITP
jgi:hypothetical protein